MDMTFTGYCVEDAGVRLNFVAGTRSGGEPSDYSIFATDAELASLTSAADFLTFVTARLNRKVKAVGIAARLDGLIGRKVVI